MRKILKDLNGFHHIQKFLNSQARQTKRLRQIDNKIVKHDKICPCHVNGDSQNALLLNLRHFKPLS